MPARLIGLIAHVGKPGAAERIRELRELVGKSHAELRLEVETARLVDAPPGVSTRELGESCDVLLVLGGDGTILQVMHELGEKMAPIFGINLGSLGFLTCVSSDDYQRAAEAVISGDFIVSHRSLLDVHVLRGGEVVARQLGLNDAVISRGEISRLIKLETLIDGVALTRYNADGLIIATATGSTAYSLAAGGPILMPESGVFVITPICPHVLTNRSVITSDIATVEVRPCPGQHGVFLTVDGQELVKLGDGDTIEIKKSARQLPLAMLPETDFFDVLRTKLRWSGAVV